jgi:GTP cyclohydrolase I
MPKEIIETKITDILTYVGENPQRDGLLETPKRVVKSYDELFKGYKTDPSDHVKLFDAEGYKDPVIVKDIDFVSCCEHHMLPFYGKVHIGYIPNGKIIGLSKFGRIVDAFSRRLQVQERLTGELVDFLMEKLEPKGIIVVVEAAHLCMVIRGIQKINSSTTTIRTAGAYSEDACLRTEFLHLINKSL